MIITKALPNDLDITLPSDYLSLALSISDYQTVYVLLGAGPTIPDDALIQTINANTKDTPNIINFLFHKGANLPPSLFEMAVYSLNKQSLLTCLDFMDALKYTSEQVLEAVEDPIRLLKTIYQNDELYDRLHTEEIFNLLDALVKARAEMEMKKNSIEIEMAYRNGDHNNFFSRLPGELRIKISAHTQDFYPQDVAEDIIKPFHSKTP